MLKSLERLSRETDGRYATDVELQFLEDYFTSMQKRISTYEKIRDAETKIIDKVEKQKQEINPELSKLNERDITDICRRNMIAILRCSAGAMLISDLDYLRDNILIWYRTIVRAYQYDRHDDTIYKLLENNTKAYLTPEEAKLIISVLQLNHTLLS
ncbi:phycobilisome protein [Gloeocapsa sp. PCC 73106]|uniref:phycobilisome protein n=1 Tax=Gloeocapsa sp. PCC 73106 TaxID=102232 RepID=UPI0002ACFD12|nr:phycobilisome protein [Gloeocapsa sp. PCC 73106]ELR98576.1 Phycobilisome protein [Gloeocapsa sp. PCC 73106]